MTYLEYCRARPEVPSDVHAALQLYDCYGRDDGLVYARRQLIKSRNAWWLCVVVNLKRLHLPFAEAVKVLR